MSTQVMVDIETWSTRPNALIVSIGAVKFDPEDPDAPFDAFHVAIDPSRHVVAETAFHIDPETMLWWLHSDRTHARERWMAMVKMDLGTALDGFAMWYGSDKTIPVWGNGATFDNVVLSEAYRAIGQERPWEFRADRCYRTLKNLTPHVKAVVPPGLDGMPHDALFDAVLQATHASVLLQRLF